jgi:hypothetical protein
MADDPIKGGHRTGLVSAQAKTTKYAMVSKIRRLGRAAQGGRQEGRKLGESGREGAEGRRSFIALATSAIIRLV